MDSQETPMMLDGHPGVERPAGRKARIVMAGLVCLLGIAALSACSDTKTLPEGGDRGVTSMKPGTTQSAPVSK